MQSTFWTYSKKYANVSSRSEATDEEAEDESEEEGDTDEDVPEESELDWKQFFKDYAHLFGRKRDFWSTSNWDF